MNIIEEIEFAPVPDSERLIDTLPDHSEIPRLSFVGRTSPGRATYVAQDRFDGDVLHALVVGGFQDRLCPHEGNWVVVTIIGAVCWATQRRLINPKEAEHWRGGINWYSLWQVAWQALESCDEVPKRLKKSLCRLLVPERHSGAGHGDRGYTGCDAAERWGNQGYAPAIKSFTEIALWAYKRGPGLEHFSAQERIFLGKMIEGMSLMLDQLHEKVRPGYQW